MQTRQTSFIGGVLAPALYGRTDLSRFAHSLRECRNFIVKQEGSAINRPGLKFLASLGSTACRLVPFVFSRNQSYVLVFDNLRVRVYKTGTLQATVVTPWLTADLPYLKFAQSGAVMTITRAGYDARELTWTNDTTWGLATVSYLSTQTAPTGLNVDSGYVADETHPVKTWQWAVTAVHDTEGGDESLPVASAALSRVVYTDKPLRLYWSAPAGGASYYNIYRGRNGKFGYVGSTPNLEFWDDGIYPVYSDPPPANRNPFAASNMKPQVVTYHQQRVLFGNTVGDPPGFWASKVGKFHCMDAGSPPKDTDSISSGIASRVFEEIRSMTSIGGGLVMLTNNTEWWVAGADGLFTPNSLSAVPFSYCGSSWLDPLTVGNQILYVQEKGTQLREIDCKGQPSGTDDLTLLATHLFEGYSVVDWCYQEVPFRQVWAVRSDGKLIGLTYVKALNVLAFSWHDLAAGSFENVCTVAEGSEDVVYAVVNLGGTRILQRMATRVFATKNDATLLDYHVTATNVTTVTGLSHLNGRSDVYAWADGALQGPFTVAGGQITLSGLAAKVCAGLRYTAELETLDLANSQAEQRGTEKIVRKVFFEVRDTVGSFSVGDTLTSTLVAAPVPTADSNGFSQGLVECLPNVTWNRDGRACVRQSNPAPLNILSLIREVEYGGV